MSAVSDIESSAEVTSYALRGWSQIDDERTFHQLLNKVKISHSVSLSTYDENCAYVRQRYADLILQMKAANVDTSEWEKMENFRTKLPKESDETTVAVVANGGDKGLDDNMTVEVRTLVQSAPTAASVPIVCADAVITPPLGMSL